ncbi:MAG: hypothetical protein JWR07_3808 [Nevskia sp.]|nr:hypothetical protein [Nevskia sp.]
MFPDVGGHSGGLWAQYKSLPGRYRKRWMTDCRACGTVMQTTSVGADPGWCRGKPAGGTGGET